MPVVKVWLGGEGPTDRRVVEHLLRKVEPAGWEVAGTRTWLGIRKFEVGAARRDGERHGDIANVRGLVLEGWEHACEVVAFVRDRDADTRRADAIATGMRTATEDLPHVEIIGGLAIPSIEGWVLALHGERDTDARSRRWAADRLRELGIADRDPDAYAAIVDAADLARLPVGCDSLQEWLNLARTVLGRAIRGNTSPR